MPLDLPGIQLSAGENEHVGDLYDAGVALQAVIGTGDATHGLQDVDVVGPVPNAMLVAASFPSVPALS